MNGFAYKTFKSRISIPRSSRILLVLITTDFQTQTFWGLVFLVLAPRVGAPGVRQNPFTLRGSVLH